MTEVNGVDVAGTRAFIAKVSNDPTTADRDPTVVARWLGRDSAAEVTLPSGEVVKIGGDQPNAMQLLIATLAACDIEVIVTRAALLGLRIDSLSVEASGHFNVARLLGIDAPERPGYQRIGYKVRLKAPGATPQQLAELQRACEEGSPVGDTLQRRIMLTMQFDAS